MASKAPFLRSETARRLALGLALAALPLVAAAVLAGEAEAAATWRVYATREGLVGGTTSNGHVIVSHDHFVALPSTKNLNCKGCTTYQVKVCNPSNGRCATAPVWDVGPWNTRDDYWNPSSQRASWTDLPQGTPEAQAAYQSGYNWVSNCKNLDGTFSGHGGGADQFGRCVLNPAGIDLADGTFWDDLGMTNNGWVDVTFLWLDNTDPVTTASLSGTKGANNWYVTSVTVTLSATDGGGSGLAATKYRLDGGSWQTYAAPFAVNTAGTHAVDYYSVDNAGNAESTKQLTFKEDRTDPVSSAAFSGTGGTAGWFRSTTVTLTLSATDATSGVAGITYRVDGGAWTTYGSPVVRSGEGAHTVEHDATDNAGNVETARTATFGIDTAPPLTTTSFAGTAGSNGWWRSPVTATLAASDALSGVAGTTAILDGNSFPYATPFAVAGEGAHALTFSSADRAGNAEASKGASIRVDTVAPTTRLDLAGPSFLSGGQRIVGGGTRFTLAASDATSGPAGSGWTWRGSAEKPYAGAFNLTGADGPGSVTWRSLDAAGNAETWQRLDVVLDGTPPLLQVQAPPDGSVVASLTPVQVQTEASDAFSGLASLEVWVDGALRFTTAQDHAAWSWDVASEAAGPHALVVRALDRVGNVAEDARTVVTVPTSVPGAMATAASASSLPQHVAAWVQGVVEQPPRLPVVGVVAEVRPASRSYRVGIAIDGTFQGAEGTLPGG